MLKKPLLILLSLSLLMAYLATTAPAEAPAQNKARPHGSSSYLFTENERETSPLSLTAADGSGLKLKLYQANTVLQGPLAFTELRLTFVNPENRQREGRFRITLPESAAISRLAMRIDDVWQEAEVVERQAARRAYEDFLHRKQDPALLEKAAGNEFRARIFPIPPQGEKELIISYSQELRSSNTPFRLNLQGLPKIDDFEINVQGQELSSPVTLKKRLFEPQGDFELTIGGHSTEALASRDYLVARISPQLDAQPQNPQNLLVLVDTSASRGLGLGSQAEMVEQVVKAMPALKRVEVAAFDQEILPLFRGTPKRISLHKLVKRGALGATDLNQALEWAAARKGYDRLLVVTDGISTAGPESLENRLQKSDIQRVDVILTGGIRDRERMNSLVQFGPKQEGVVIPGDLGTKDMVRSLTRSVTSGLDVSVEGAEWTWPETLDNLQPGDQRLVYAKLSKPSQEYSVRVGSEQKVIIPRPVDTSPLLTRQATVARIAKLENQLADTEDPEIQQNLNDEIVSLSTTHRVLSAKTALLVLESDSDYQRFGIDRTALADVLTVTPEGLSLVARSEINVPKPVLQVAKKPQTGGNKMKRKADAGLSASKTEFDGRPSFQDITIEEKEEERPELSEPMADSNTQTTMRRPPPAPTVPSDGPEDSTLDESEVDADQPEPKMRDTPVPLSGRFQEIKALLESHSRSKALLKAQKWQKDEPGNVLALIALGDCLQALGRKREAARVFGSIIDLFPSRADLRRYAASRLQSLGEEGLDLAIDCFQKAAEQRPDHVSSHRFLAFAQARNGSYSDAVESLERGLSRRYPDGRFRSYERILKDDLGLLCAAWLRSNPDSKVEIYKHLKKYGTKLAKQPSLRFILTWETDANDVDFHIRDSSGGHAYYSEPKLASGGELYGDVTTGYGPECFAIEGKAQAYPYDLQIHYYSRGPMGYGMGQLEVLKHDGKGRLSYEERPYVVMTDGAYVNLGKVTD